MNELKAKWKDRSKNIKVSLLFKPQASMIEHWKNFIIDVWQGPKYISDYDT